MASDDASLSSIPEVNCKICLCSVPKEESVDLKLCGCSFCRECLRQMVQINVDGRTVQRLKCPGPHSTSIVRQEVKALVDQETFIRYIRLLHENAVLMDPSRSFCPRPTCGAVCHSSSKPGARAVRCVECGHKFCSLCREKWPGPAHQCPEDLHVTSQPRASTPTHFLRTQFFRDDSTLDVNGDAPSSSSANEENGGKEAHEVKRCPRCGVPIERREGCAHMKCARCGHNFCWFCLANLDHDYFLHHFESGPCREALGHPRAIVHLYRLQAICVICGLGAAALLCAPFAILCAPCIVLCAPYLPTCFTPAENAEVQMDQLNHFSSDEFGDDTDGEADDPEE